MDDDFSLSCLNDWDRKIKNFDVIYDYKSEKKEIYKAGRLHYEFLYSRILAKILLGSMVPEIDDLDEKPKCSVL
jgi:hypothetical protein